MLVLKSAFDYSRTLSGSSWFLAKSVVKADLNCYPETNPEDKARFAGGFAMKKTALVLFSLLLGLSLCACGLTKKTVTNTRNTQASAETTTKVDPVNTSQTTAAPTVKVTTSSKVTATESVQTTTTATSMSTSISPTSTAAATTTTSETTDPAMYSSYAFLVSFDPESNLAEFDYFDMLRGKEAVDFLVKHEGQTKDEAQALVDDFADSEFVISNLNERLREINLAEVSLSLMYQPSGDMSESGPLPSSLADFKLIFELDPLLLTESFFFYIDVSDDGQVALVEQVYWP
jgi:hypothetical protein